MPDNEAIVQRVAEIRERINSHRYSSGEEYAELMRELEELKKRLPRGGMQGILAQPIVSGESFGKRISSN